MRVRTAFSFDHIKPVLSSSANWAKAIGDIPLKVRAIQGTKTGSILANGWITCAPFNSSASTYLMLPTASVIKDNPDVSWFGVRTKLVSQGWADSSTLLMFLASPSYVASSSYTALFTLGMLGASIPDQGNKEIYLEVGINWVEKTVERRIDGIFHSTIAITNIPAGEVTSKALGIYLGGSVVTNHQSDFRDLYYADYTADGGRNAPLGPQRTALMVGTVDPETPWTPVGSSNGIQGVLNEKLDLTSAATLDAPTLTVEGNNIPLNISMKLPDGVKAGAINGLFGFLSAGLSTGNPATVMSKLKQGGITVDGKTTAVTTNMTHGITSIVADRAPDGGAWTKATLESAAVSVEAV